MGVFRDIAELSHRDGAELLSARAGQVAWRRLVGGPLTPEHLHVTFLDFADVALDINVITGEVWRCIEQLDEVFEAENVRVLVQEREIHFRERSRADVPTPLQLLAGFLQVGSPVRRAESVLLLVVIR